MPLYKRMAKQATANPFGGILLHSSCKEWTTYTASWMKSRKPIPSFSGPVRARIPAV